MPRMPNTPSLYQGGSSTVTVNQRVNGGQWNLLGTFPFESGGTGYKVELSDDVATGKVAADAIRYVLDESSADSFTWMLDVPSAGSYQLYARWVAASANTSAAQYTVTHAGGSSPVTVSQKQNGGQWHLLGTYNFAPDAGHKVTLAAAADGTVIADAVLLVGSGAPPSNLLYIHADHLGTPQKLTDAGQAIVWDGEFEPFGEEIAISGTAELPLRFPGQYADAETGYSYNYFRDYDPTLGRYLQSDPIGLAGGINTYAYVEANPIIKTDPKGQSAKSRIVESGNANSSSGSSARIKSALTTFRNAACREECYDKLPTGDFGFRFWKCLNACYIRNGCL
jgi:RHS repeat-associated protein